MGVVIVMLGCGILGNAVFAQIFQKFLQTASPSCVFYYYLHGTITTLAVDTNGVCDSCQALQAEREGETHQHIGLSGGTL